MKKILLKNYDNFLSSIIIKFKKKEKSFIKKFIYYLI